MYWRNILKVHLCTRWIYLEMSYWMCPVDWALWITETTMFHAAKQKNCHRISTFLFADSGEFVKVLHCLFFGGGGGGWMRTDYVWNFLIVRWKALNLSFPSHLTSIMVRRSPVWFDLWLIGLGMPFSISPLKQSKANILGGKFLTKLGQWWVPSQQNFSSKSLG